jgi:hypothetical protein
MIGNPPGKGPSTAIGAEPVRSGLDFGRCGDRCCAHFAVIRRLGDVAAESGAAHESQRATWRRRWQGVMRLRFSIRAYMLLVVCIAGITALYKLIPWMIRTYHP